MPPPPGDCFFPPSEDRLLCFLRLQIDGEPLPAAATTHFHDTDIYAADPSLLTMLFESAPAKKGESGSWFFFTRVRPKSRCDSRKSRQVAGGVGTWHSERAPRRVLDDEGNCAGHSQYFSYKLKTGKNCSERTEFSLDQEADHDGEPQLVLCKIYKAHTQSRSSSGSGSASRPSCSASARKRKAVVDEASAPPVKAKRRLFDSTAPAASAVSLQEQIGSNGWISGEAATSQGSLVDVLQHLGDASDSAAFMSKAATSQGKVIGISDWFPLMSNSGGEVAPSQGKTGDTSGCIALMSKADNEVATPQLKIGDASVFSRFWPEPEPEAATFDGGHSMMTGGDLPMPENCSRAIVRDVGDLFCRRNAWSSAFSTSNDTTASVMPSAPVLPPGEASWWYGTGSHNVWSF